MHAIVKFTFVLCLLSLADFLTQCNSNLVEGDISMTPKEARKMSKEMKKTGGTIVKLWKDGVVPYTISREFSTSEQDEINDVMQEISGDTCIQFIPRTKEKDYIYFQLGNRCNSRIGHAGGKQVILMNPQSCMKPGTVIHEIIHSLGFWHEQSRPDRDQYITVKKENIKPESRQNFHTYETPFTRTYELPYDYGSIMHYSRFAFQRKTGLQTIFPKEENAPIGLRVSMSYFDKLKINLAYKCES